MFVIHGMCDAEMRVVEEPVFQGYDFSAIGTPNASHYVKPRIDTVRWYECPDCKARIRESEIMDGVRFADGKPVVINGQTVQTGVHRIVWHGGQKEASLRIERETAMDRYKRLAREAGVDLHESTDCPPGQFFATNSAYIAPNATEGGSPLTVEHLREAIARIRESLNPVNDGWSNRADDEMHDRFSKPGSLNWSGADTMNLTRVAYVYETWDDTKLWPDRNPIHELNRQQMFMRDAYGVSTLPIRFPMRVVGE